MYVLDTNVISELRKAKTGKADKRVMDWAAGVESSTLFLSVITILELETGILLIARRDKKQGDALRVWLNNQVLPSFAGRILSIDVPVAQRCAMLCVPNPRGNRDSLIAATALTHNMTVVTRNVADFVPMGVEVHNPWQSTING
jgi:predicted nucleic acid-binding protein